MATTIQIRRDTAANWTSQVLFDGEIGYETDTGNFKVGDGVTAWSALAYQFPYSTGLKTSALSATLSVDNANDRVGIGTSTPAQTLDVVGTAAVSGNTTVGGTLGVTGATTLSDTLGVTGATTLSDTLGVTGLTTLAGDLAVNGGDITTTTTGTARLFNSNATVVQIGQSAQVSIGATTGTTTIRNAATIAGDLAVNGGDITTTITGTATLFNSNATTLNVGSAATTVTIGAITGTTTIRNDLAVAGGDITLQGTGRIQGVDTVSSGNDAANKNYVDKNLTQNATDPPIGTIVIASVTTVFNGGTQTAGQSPAAIGNAISIYTGGPNNVNRYSTGNVTGSTAVSGTWRVVCYMDDDGGGHDHAWVMVIRTA